MPSEVRLAFDIETVSPTVPDDQYPNFDDPTDFEIFSGAVAIEEDGDLVETTNDFREGWGRIAELDLIEILVERLERASPDVTYTVNGEGFDFWLLHERARICGAETDDMSLFNRIDDIERRVNHEDLQPDIWGRWGQYTTLEEALNKTGIGETPTRIKEWEDILSPPGWNQSAAGPTLQSSDIPVLAEAYLDGIEQGREDEGFLQLESMLDHYGRADVDDLFALADARPY